MIEVYGIKNCNKIRDTLSWLEEEGVEYRFIDVKKDPVSREQLEGFVQKAGLETLVNKRGMKWRKLGLADRELSDRELFDQLLEHQTMIKRPLMVRGLDVIAGYDEDAFEEFIT
ncbi:MAG: arsenate reductase family protein [Balneolaceae bacterium]